jgi:hypothetical protein
MATRPRRRLHWTPAAIPVGLLLMALGAWAFFVPLVGPYFNYGFFTSTTWVFSGVHWELLLGAGIAIFCGGLLLTVPSLGLGALGSLLAFAGGAWLLVGPSLYPLWTSTVNVPHTQGMRALLEIGYFYGTGALVMYLTGFGNGLLSRRTTVHDEPRIEETPVERDERIVTHA